MARRWVIRIANKKQLRSNLIIRIQFSPIIINFMLIQATSIHHTLRMKEQRLWFLTFEITGEVNTFHWCRCLLKYYQNGGYGDR